VTVDIGREHLLAHPVEVASNHQEATGFERVVMRDLQAFELIQEPTRLHHRRRFTRCISHAEESERVCIGQMMFGMLRMSYGLVSLCSTMLCTPSISRHGMVRLKRYGLQSVQATQ